MKKKIKVGLTVAIIADALLAIILLIIQKFHDCDHHDCLICALVAIGFAFVGIISLALILFPLVHSLKIKITNFRIRNERKIPNHLLKHIDIIANFTLVNSFVKIQ